MQDLSARVRFGKGRVAPESSYFTGETGMVLVGDQEPPILRLHSNHPFLGK